MTKAEIVSKICEKLGVEKSDAHEIVNMFMSEIKDSLETGQNVYLRGFGSFVVKTRKAKKGRNISKNITIDIPAHKIPSFKPAKVFLNMVKNKVKIIK
ncbi:MAG: HU family DNA-binding protein [Bacteroidota bacterium]|nr:HU family DNA-binding protein [Bacteroidota bacterium]